MTIDWTAFTPWASLAGGVLIGLAALLLAFANGRVAGVSGILGGLRWLSTPDAKWRFAFVAGLVLAPALYSLFARMPDVVVDASYPLLVVAGLAVGVGTRYGAGCTSGHGVCGMSRLSPRSVVATLAFMASGFATVFAMRHVLGA